MKRPDRATFKTLLAAGLAASFALALAGCSSGGGGGRRDAGGGPPPPGDADADTVLDGVDNCPGVANPGQEDTDADGIGNACEAAVPCSDDFGNGQMDGTACYRDPSVANTCGTPFDLRIFATILAGDLDVLVSTSGGAGGATPEPGATNAVCDAACAGDVATFTCDFTDDGANVRTIIGTVNLATGEIDGTIETACGDTAAFSADDRPDAHCN